jgi:RecA/RadA recombinase
MAKKSTDALETGSGRAFFKSLIKSIGDPDTHAAEDGTASAEFIGGTDTGSYILNAALSGSLFGGAPNNKIIGFAGDPTTGKTFFVMGIAKRWLDDHADGCLIYYDTEAAVTKQMMADRGIDISRVYITEPETIQKFRHNLLQVLDGYTKRPKSERPPLLVILDSLGMMSTTKEMEDTTEGKETKDMTKPGIIKATFRVLGLKLAKVGVNLFVTNHVYAAIGAYVPTKIMGGGSGLPYAASQIVTLTKSKERDDDKNVTGNIISCTMTKSRFTKENLKVKVRLTYDHGLDRYYGLMDLALDNGIVTKDGNRYVFPDGQKAFMKHIEESPTTYFTQDFLNILETVVAKTFKYGTPDTIEGTAAKAPEDEAQS